MSARPAETCPPLAVPEVAMDLVGDDPPNPSIVAPEGSLASFVERAARIMRKAARDHVRIAVYGDSNGSMDFITGAMRRALHEKFGDGGHGFVAAGRPWIWYRHRDVEHELMNDAWTSYAASTHPLHDGHYGHGLIAAESRQGEAKIWYGTARAGAPTGTRVSRFEVFYLAQPGGGRFDVRVGSRTVRSIDTEEKSPVAKFEALDLEDGPHQFSLVTTTPRPVRLMGAVLERSPSEGASFVVDSLGVGALNCLGLLRDSDRTNEATLRRRKYDLIVFHIGSNTFHSMPLATCWEKVITRTRRALPGVPILMMTAPDYLVAPNAKQSAPWLLAVNDSLRAVARSFGLALYDFHAAMGGNGAMAWFAAKGMTQPGDFVHLGERGGAYMGKRIVAALLGEVSRASARNPSLGCGAPPELP